MFSEFARPSPRGTSEADCGLGFTIDGFAHQWRRKMFEDRGADIEAA